jgi:hypothetical protein
MKIYHYLYRISLSCVSLICLIHFHVLSQQSLVQDDPVHVPNVVVSPIVDGIGNDPCWENIPWQSIAQVWIPYGGKVDSGDYSGHYKAMWSSTTNLLYFLVEAIDDVFVDGFIPGVTTDIYNYDIIEVFIDENKSGGLHVFDGKDSIGIPWGTNAENAFAYHIYAPFPKEGQVTTKCHVYDLAGTSWPNAQRMNYASHLPTFALRKTGNKATWEFSLIVYNDTYEDTMAHKDSARVRLQEGKTMGLSLAYCDNDKPDVNPKTRDNFFGSVWVPAPAYNDHWMNADYFGTVKLITHISSVVPNHY